MVCIANFDHVCCNDFDMITFAWITNADKMCQSLFAPFFSFFSVRCHCLKCFLGGSAFSHTPSSKTKKMRFFPHSHTWTPLQMIWHGGLQYSLRRGFDDSCTKLYVSRKFVYKFWYSSGCWITTNYSLPFHRRDAPSEKIHMSVFGLVYCLTSQSISFMKASFCCDKWSVGKIRFHHKSNATEIQRI